MNKNKSNKAQLDKMIRKIRMQRNNITRDDRDWETGEMLMIHYFTHTL